MTKNPGPATDSGPYQDPSSQQVKKRLRDQVISVPTSHDGQLQLHQGYRIPESFVYDSVLSQLQKKPRLGINQEDVLYQQVLQQYMRRQDPMHMQKRQWQQQEQFLQSMPPMQRAKLMEHHQQLQLRQHVQQGVQPSPAVKHPQDGGVCSRRILQYLYHQRQRPADNSISYWRKFVAEYYSPRAKKRWYLSQYDTVGQQSLELFPQSAMGAWQCGMCGSKSGKGYEATFEVLPRLNEIKFSSGVIDEVLYLDLPRECRMPSGMMMLEYAKVVQESVYEQLRVVHEGQLRIIFTTDLKILVWEFCARRHEELVSCRVIAPQVNQILQAAQKCQSTISESGPDGISPQDIQNNNNLVTEAGHQLAKTFELQSLNDLGFSKRQARCLQIGEVVNSMKDLMDFCRVKKVGPIEELEKFPSRAMATNMKMQKTEEMDQHGGIQGLPNYRDTHDKLMASHPGISNGDMNGSAQASLSLTDYQNLLMRRSLMDSNSVQQDATPFFVESSPSSSSSLQGLGGVLQGNSMNLPSSHLYQQSLERLLQQSSLNSNGSQSQQHHNSSRNAVQQRFLSGQSGSLLRDGIDFSTGTLVSNVATSNGPGNVVASNPSSNAGFNHKAPDVAHNRHFSDEMFQNVQGFLNNEIDDNMNHGWKG